MALESSVRHNDLIMVIKITNPSAFPRTIQLGKGNTYVTRESERLPTTIKNDTKQVADLDGQAELLSPTATASTASSPSDVMDNWDSPETPTKLFSRESSITFTSPLTPISTCGKSMERTLITDSLSSPQSKYPRVSGFKNPMNFDEVNSVRSLETKMQYGRFYQKI